jgi:hypothetical protein
MMNILFVLLTTHYAGNVKKNCTGGACSTYGREEVQTGLRWENITEGDQLRNLGVDGKLILNFIFKN